MRSLEPHAPLFVPFLLNRATAVSPLLRVRVHTSVSPLGDCRRPCLPHGSWRGEPKKQTTTATTLTKFCAA